jgi:hypothetical protein
VNQYFARIAAEQPITVLNAKAYVLLIVTIERGVMKTG